MAAKAKSSAPRIVNRRARHDYHVTAKLEVGLVLLGSEVKSIRQGQVSLAEGYARIEPDQQLYLYDVDIGAYQHAAAGAHEPKRRRKLLAHRKQIRELAAQTGTKGTTLVPLAIYFVRGRAKLELGVGQGRRGHDKRRDMETKAHKHEMRKAMTRKRL
ncbi:MAG: SsrA-binding protein [Phycisphaeraceae bacterium]|nr:SsrA-binding protein [Phycisphaeraceae bacterium]